ncbi:MAG TPA: LysR family transcriptional regulator [Solirubrobacter sp.]
MHDLRRLRAFHAVAEHGSFSAAGLELGYAQSVVSHHVAALEQQLGLTLINRGTRPVSVTDAGARLRHHAEIILGQVSAAEDDLRAIAGVEGGTLKVGAFLSACNTFVPAAVARFERDHPGVELEVEQLEEPAAQRKLRSGDLDVAVVWRIPDVPGVKPEDGIDELHLANDPYWIVLPARHRLGRRRQISLADLAGERFIAPPVSDYTVSYQAMLEQLWSHAGIEPRTLRVQDVTVARAMISAGLSAGILSELTMSEPRGDITVRPIRDANPHRALYATWLRGRRVPAGARMVRYLAEAAQTRLGVREPAAAS